MGYALHAVGRLEEAIEAHIKASENPRTRPFALYNLACAYCLMGNADQALVQLERAVDHGFRDESTIRGDADLAVLRERPEFDELARRAGEKTEQGPYRELDFMVGVWQVHGQDGQRLGQSVITKDEQGYLLTEKWEASDGSTGTGISYYDAKARAWRQTFVGMIGNILHMQGNLASEVLSMQGESVFTNRLTAMSRSVTTPNGDGSFRFVLDESRDGGKTWTNGFDGTYTRVP